MTLKDRFRRISARVLALKGDRAAIARGMALGVFIGATPTIPFHTALVLGLGVLFRQHIGAAYVGTWVVSNPLTIPVLYVTQYELGSLLTGMGQGGLQFTDYSLVTICSMGGKILIPLLVGGLVMAPFLALAAFFVTKRLLEKARS
jgi:uncharacterized protein (DUF2062 family)